MATGATHAIIDIQTTLLRIAWEIRHAVTIHTAVDRILEFIWSSQAQSDGHFLAALSLEYGKGLGMFVVCFPD
jgi:hypothetical protein